MTFGSPYTSSPVWTGSFAGMACIAAAMVLLPLGATLSKLLTETPQGTDVLSDHREKAQDTAFSRFDLELLQELLVPPLRQ
ncbi:hypothetical protein AL036_16210 [Salipiger aestuarii]|uniref:hypothetical protein n=1 Tax=Salipiger aestuarii TaxID=568098 RepID=UPI00123A9ABF|nr:hypothetical protein [Salipiger aestuarii]KAA8606074.1 hypothetical protein AL036_16210 [Salipiger aestuarii]